MHARGRFPGIAIAVALTLSIAAGTPASAGAQEGLGRGAQEDLGRGAQEDLGRGAQEDPGSEGGPAASPERHTPREAVELFQRSREHYRNGRYEDAAHDLESALVLDPGSPTLLYNLGRVYELSGEHDRAIATYENYLRVVPAEDAAERERTEAAIRRLQGARGYERPDEEVYSQALYVSQRGVADDAFWITLVSGAVITLGGAALAVTTALLQSDVDAFVLGQDGTLMDRQVEFDRVSTLALATDIVGAVGGATLLAAGLLWLLRERSVEMYPSAQPIASLDLDLRGGASLVVRGSF